MNKGNPQTIDYVDGLDIRRTGGGFLSLTAPLSISDGVVVFSSLLTWSTNPSRIEWDPTNGPLSKLLELLDTRV